MREPRTSDCLIHSFRESCSENAAPTKLHILPKSLENQNLASGMWVNARLRADLLQGLIC
ncbi:MAG: hypothetical protein FRX49_08508 [Trebouxia sp. A1-2]|nr:MAG: hypothetical protein FRX49_08508 [Trebouxia sp. A1-2]